MNGIEETAKKIKEVGKERKCYVCGKPYRPLPLPALEKIFPNETHIVYVPSCSCMFEIEKQAEQTRIEATRKARVEKIFNNSMMTPFFREKRFENLDMTENLKFCKEYADNFNPNGSKGLQFIGDIGTGKTTALACICNQLMDEGYPCLFTTFSALLNKFANYSYEHAGDIVPLLNDLTNCDFVVLDDLGRENYTDKRKELAFAIIDHLLNYKITVAITANPNIIAKLTQIEEWQAILDRLFEMCPISLQFNSKSMRGGNG